MLYRLIFMLCVFGSPPLFAMTASSQLKLLNCCTIFEGSRWRVVSYQDGNTLVSVFSNNRFNLLFAQQERVSGVSGCNRFSGFYHVGAGKLSFSQLASTKMFCMAPEGVMQQESAFLKSMMQSTAYTIEGPLVDHQTLDLINDDGKVVVHLEKMK